MSYVPVIIIGAGRSGTNMLRDILTRLPGVVTWPCDEINYIWRHGNVTHPTDEFSAAMVTPKIKRFVTRAFDRLAKPGVTHVVEKTCANSLRVGFVEEAVPNARYIHLVRDGRDVAVSAAKRWKAPLDLPYILRKARYVPMSDVHYYASRYLMARLHRFKSTEKRLSSWGPRFDGMDHAHTNHDLNEVCALQWQRCVERSDDAFASIESSRVCQLRYEDFVVNPAAHIRNIGTFIGLPISPVEADSFAAGVSAGSVGAAQRCLTPDQWNRLSDLVAETLEKHGYPKQAPERKAA